MFFFVGFDIHFVFHVEIFFVTETDCVTWHENPSVAKHGVSMTLKMANFQRTIYAQPRCR